MVTPAQEAQMRKVAFYVGVVRYFHRHGKPAVLEKLAADGAGVLAMAALGVPVVSYLAGRHAGRFAGNMYGNAATPSPVSLAGREYELADAATQRLIDELNAERVNSVVADTMAEPEREKKAKAPKPLFASPSLLRYGR
jgi:hypothetical protein